MPRPKGSKNKPKDQPMPTKTVERTAEHTTDTAESKGDVAIFQPARLPYHPAIEERFGVDKGQWKVLVEAIFPAAKTVDAIVMVLSYCKARNLDPLKRPVHIVPMWDGQRGAMVETVWPGISELRTTASRTKGYAGIDAAEFGDEMSMTFEGRVKVNGNWETKKLEVTFPEWCRLTVYRIVDGQRCKFVGPKVSWLETYATQGKSELPNNMWESRPEGQLEKCAEAAALRRAFPEEIGNELTAEEMIGRNIHDIAGEIPHVAAEAAPETAADRDTAPPRAIPQSQAEPPVIEVSEVEERTPPPRQPKAETVKDDPISSGPPRTVAKPAEPKAEPAKSNPASAPKPHRIPGKDHTYESWCEAFCDLVKTSDDTATVYKWIDENSKDFSDPPGAPVQKGPLERLKLKKPTVYAEARKVIENTMQTLRDIQAREAEKAAKKKAAAAPPPSDMDGPDDGPAESHQDAAVPQNPDDVLKWIEATLAAVTEPEDLENVWEQQVEPKLQGMFPPDIDEAQAIYRKHSKRLEP